MSSQVTAVKENNHWMSQIINKAKHSCLLRPVTMAGRVAWFRWLLFRQFIITTEMTVCVCVAMHIEREALWARGQSQDRGVFERESLTIDCRDLSSAGRLPHFRPCMRELGAAAGASGSWRGVQLRREASGAFAVFGDERAVMHDTRRQPHTQVCACVCGVGLRRQAKPARRDEIQL